jgi:hypothetical protein
MILLPGILTAIILNFIIIGLVGAIKLKDDRTKKNIN